jgi:hypothetical protein
MSFLLATNVLDRFQNFVGNKWVVSLNQDYDSYVLRMSYKIPPLLKNPDIDFAKALGEIKYLGDLQEQVRDLKEANEKMSQELEVYKNLLPNLKASLSTNGGFESHE